MTSDKKIFANRQNALKSTGPRTVGGKEISRSNAVTHGLTATKLVLPGESEEEYTLFLEGLMSDYAPATPVEANLVERFAGYLWRLKRVPAFEAALHVWSDAQQEALHDKEPFDIVDEYINPSSSKSLAAGRIYGRSPGVTSPRASKDQLKLGRALEALIMKGDVLSKLSRYEAHLSKLAREALKDLAIEQERRKARGRSGVGEIGLTNAAGVRIDAGADAGWVRRGSDGDEASGS